MSDWIQTAVALLVLVGYAVLMLAAVPPRHQQRLDQPFPWALAVGLAFVFGVGVGMVLHAGLRWGGAWN